MGLPTAEIQTALISRYRGDVGLQALLIGAVTPEWNIYDMGAVPTGQKFPYVALYPIISQSGTAMTLAVDAVDTYVQVSMYTQYVGFAQARGIAKYIYSITNRQALSLSGGFTNFFLLFDNENEVEEGDGITQQIAHRYRLMTQG